MTSRGVGIAAAAVSSLCAAMTPGCAPPADAPEAPIDFLDPQACAGCHPAAFDAWSGSMHAYAAHDPLFRALNARGQRETDGALGDLCVRCHAPVAWNLGLTTDGLNLDALDPKVLGVTCAWCHSVVDVTGTHNNALAVDLDGTMRGAMTRPARTSAHGAAYSPWHDRNRAESSAMCGACHDVVNGHGTAVERTFAEWQGSIFAHDGDSALACTACHMRPSDGQAAAGGPARRVHDHAMPAVDVALTAFPNRDAQRAAVLAALEPTVLSRLCVEARFDGGADVLVEVENVAAGHGFPSGAAADRRVWVELVGYVGGEVVFESGAVADDEVLRGRDDPQLWEFGERWFDAEGSQVHFFWEATRTESTALPAQTALRANDPRWTDTHRTRVYALATMPDRVTLRVLVRPIGLDLLDRLVASGDLDGSVRAAAPTFEVGAARLDWQASSGDPCAP